MGLKIPLWLRDFLKHDGSRTLTADWDIGNGRMIKADKVRARDGDGLALYEDGGAGIFVKDGGNVGIGTASPGVKLDVSKSGDNVSVFKVTAAGGTQNDTIAQIRSGASSSGFKLFSIDYGAGYVNNALTVRGDGNVGIGMTSPGVKLDVSKSGNNVSVFKVTAAGGTQNDTIAQIRSGASGSGFKLFSIDYGAGYVNNALTVRGDGNVGIGTASPNRKLEIVSGNYNAILLSSSITDNTAKGAGITGARKVNSNAPFTGFVTWDDGSNRGVYMGGGGWGFPDLTQLEFYTAPTYNETIDQGILRMVIKSSGNVGIGTASPANPLAVNRSGDGTIVDFESADAVEGTISIAGNTTSYNAFMGAHFTQLKAKQKLPPVGAIVIATGEIVPCEVHIKIPVVERYYEDEIEVSLKEALEDDFIEEQVDTERKKNVYTLINRKVIKTQTPIFETAKRIIGKKFKENFRLDNETGKIYEKVIKVLNEGEEPPENVTILERQKIKNGKPITAIKTNDVSGVEKKEYFSYVELASKSADSRVYGVYHAKMSDDAKGQSFGEDGKSIYQIAAVGLYKVRVTDTNGNIKCGDYIQSSIRLGEGEKQNDDVLHNYTVAKAIVDVNWNEIAIDQKLGYKWKLIPATLHCG